MVEQIFRQLGVGVQLATVAAKAYRNGRVEEGDEAKAKAENAYSKAIVAGSSLPREEWARLQKPLGQLRNAINGLYLQALENVRTPGRRR